MITIESLLLKYAIAAANLHTDLALAETPEQKRDVLARKAFNDYLIVLLGLLASHQIGTGDPEAEK